MEMLKNLASLLSTDRFVANLDALFLSASSVNEFINNLEVLITFY